MTVWTKKGVNYCDSFKQKDTKLQLILQEKNLEGEREYNRREAQKGIYLQVPHG